MKSAVTTISIILFSFSMAFQGYAQDVPQNVKQAFSDKFANATEIEWEQEDDRFEADFQLGGIEYEAEFLADGTWKQTEREINSKQLPQPIQQSISKKYKGAEIGEAVKINKKNETLYEVGLETEEEIHKEKGEEQEGAEKKEQEDKDEEEEEEELVEYIFKKDGTLIQPESDEQKDDK